MEKQDFIHHRLVYEKKSVTSMHSVYRMIFDEFDMVPIYAVNKDRQI
jgi:hypothetical protein